MFRSSKYTIIAICIIFTCYLHGKPLYIFLEGLGGSGKTTLANLIQKALPSTNDITNKVSPSTCEIIFEPLEKWFDVEGTGDLFDRFIKNTERWAFTAEFFIPFARTLAIEQRIKKSQASTFLIDRSMHMDRYCFARTVHNMGIMDDMEWEIYSQWFNWFMKNSPIQPSGFIFLRSTVATVMERIKKRDRIEEKDYPIDLQRNFHQCFEDFFINKSTLPEELENIPILVLDANKNLLKDTSIRDKYLNKIKKFIRNINIQK